MQRGGEKFKYTQHKIKTQKRPNVGNQYCNSLLFSFKKESKEEGLEIRENWRITESKWQWPPWVRVVPQTLSPQSVGGESSVRLVVHPIIEHLSGASWQQQSCPIIFSCRSHWRLGNDETSWSLTLLYTAVLRIRAWIKGWKVIFAFLAFQCLFARNKICYTCSVLWQKIC